jgi:hypothetical protein
VKELARQGGGMIELLPFSAYYPSDQVFVTVNNKQYGFEMRIFTFLHFDQLSVCQFLYLLGTQRMTSANCSMMLARRLPVKSTTTQRSMSLV